MEYLDTLLVSPSLNLLAGTIISLAIGVLGVPVARAYNRSSATRYRKYLANRITHVVMLLHYIRSGKAAYSAASDLLSIAMAIINYTISSAAGGLLIFVATKYSIVDKVGIVPTSAVCFIPMFICGTILVRRAVGFQRRIGQVLSPESSLIRLIEEIAGERGRFLNDDEYVLARATLEGLLNQMPVDARYHENLATLADLDTMLRSNVRRHISVQTP